MWNLRRSMRQSIGFRLRYLRRTIGVRFRYARRVAKTQLAQTWSRIRALAGYVTWGNILRALRDPVLEGCAALIAILLFVAGVITGVWAIVSGGGGNENIVPLATSTAVAASTPSIGVDPTISPSVSTTVAQGTLIPPVPSSAIGALPANTPIDSTSTATVVGQPPPKKTEDPPIFGPIPGVLKHDRDPASTAEGINWYYKSGVDLRDFKAEATFHNPYGYPNPEKKRFDYGFMFRKGSNDEGYHLAVGPTGAWFLELKTESGQLKRLYEAGDGTIKNLNASEDGQNKLRLEVEGKTARFYVNDVLAHTYEFGLPTTTPVTDLDVSGLTTSGDIWVVTGFLQENTIQEKLTQFSDFTIWSLDP